MRTAILHGLHIHIDGQAGVPDMGFRSAIPQILTCALFLFAAPIRGDDRAVIARAVDSAGNLAIGEQLQEALDVGFKIGPRRMQEAQDRLDRVRSLVEDDPRIDYSHGLVLIRQSQMKLAISQFESAIEQEGPPFWPAWKTAIWTQLIDKRYAPALNRLIEFAGLVHDAETPVTASEDRPDQTGSEVSENQREAARWIGQLFEALSQLPDAKKHKAFIEESQSRVLDILGEDLLLSVEEGRELLRARAHEQGLATIAARDLAGQAAKNRKLDKDLDAADKGNGPKTKDDWKKWIDGILASADKQLRAMDRDYQSLSQRAAGLANLHGQATAQLTTAKANMTLLHHQGQHLAMAMLKDQLVACNNQMLACQVEYNVVVDQMSNVAERASQIANRRASAIARYEQETGDMIPKNPDLDKWVTRLHDKKPKMASKPAPKTPQKDAAEKKPVVSLRSLMPLDLERERDAVLESFGVRRPAPASIPAPAEETASPASPAAPAGK